MASVTLALGCLLLRPLMMGVMMLMTRDRDGAEVDHASRRRPTPGRLRWIGGGALAVAATMSDAGVWCHAVVA
ncbi:MAG TPA: hypothetical protein VIX82_11330 [Solirubrobacteraceae bacterium]